MPPDLAQLALASGATQLGEDGPDGCHYIFSRDELEAFVAALVGMTGEIPAVLAPPPY